MIDPRSTATEQRPSAEEAVTDLPSISALQTRKIGRTRRTVTSRFKGFDDDFDTSVTLESIPAVVDQRGSGELPVEGHGLFVSQPQNMDIDQPVDASAQYGSGRQHTPAAAVEEEAEEDLLDQLAAAA